MESRRRFNWVFADFGAMLCKESLPTRALGWSFSILKVSPLSALSGEGLVHYQVSEGLILLSSSLNNTLKPSPCCTGCHSIRYIYEILRLRDLGRILCPADNSGALTMGRGWNNGFRQEGPLGLRGRVIEALAVNTHPNNSNTSAPSTHLVAEKINPFGKEERAADNFK